MENTNTFSAMDMYAFAFWMKTFHSHEFKAGHLSDWVEFGRPVARGLERIKAAIAEVESIEEIKGAISEESPWVKRMEETIKATEASFKPLQDALWKLGGKYTPLPCNELASDQDARANAFSDEQMDKWDPQVFKAICDNPDEILRQFINYAVVCLGSGIALRPDELKTLMKITSYFIAREDPCGPKL